MKTMTDDEYSARVTEAAAILAAEWREGPPLSVTRWYARGCLPLLLSSYSIVTTVGFLVYFYL